MLTVILSAAKDLYAHILRCAQNDNGKQKDDILADFAHSVQWVMRAMFDVLALKGVGVKSQKNEVAATGGLAIILGQLVTYFTNRTQIDDLDVLSFSLHHLFCRVDFLYNDALPALAGWTATQMQPDTRQRQQIWTQLQTINRALDRMEPLCHLLSDATECILESFDLTSDMIPLIGSENALEQEETSSAKDWLQVVDPERWEQAFSAVTQHLLSWQEHHTTLPTFSSQFAHLLPTTPTLPELDTAFATILDNAGAIFGDILPGFRAILAADESMVAALLYDLMQQSDQLLVKFETTLEPMNALTKHYAIGPELS